MGGVDLNHIGGDNCEWLERAIEEEEVHVAVECFARDKASWPNSFLWLSFNNVGAQSKMMF